jgi:anti-sigma factor RsiW
MDCTEARFGLYALLDDELDIAQNLELLSHLEGCPACQQELELDARLKALVREQLSASVPSPDLWRKVMRQIAQEGERERVRWSSIGRLWRPVRFPPIAMAALVLLVVCSVALLAILPRQAPALLMQELVSDHRRASARPEGPVEIPASDPASIVARFHEKLPARSSVPVLVHGDAKLLGGSFCQFSQTKGIRFTYEVGAGRTVSLYQLERSEDFPIPSSGPGRLFAQQVQGFGIVLWGHAHVVYALVADLSTADLQRLAAYLDGV